MISVCLPTRGRPESFKAVCQSMLETANEPDDIEFVSYHDEDDTSKYEYIGNHKEVVGKRLYNYSQMWNECAKVANGPYYLYQADDIRFTSSDWDTKIRETFEQSKDKILFVYFNNHRSSNFGCIYCIHKNWVDTVGYLTPPYFSSHLPDNWMNDVAKAINRRVYLEDVTIKHFYIQDDDTHKEYLKRREDDKPWEIYTAKRKERKGDIVKLQKFIDEYDA